MRRDKSKPVKSEMQKGRYQKTPWKSRTSSETILRMHNPINLKILKKWADF
jgi:hypothetical protein